MLPRVSEGISHAADSAVGERDWLHSAAVDVVLVNQVLRLLQKIKVYFPAITDWLGRVRYGETQ